MIDGLQHELCETEQVKVKSLVYIVIHWIGHILISGVETSEDNKVGEFEK